MNLESTVSRPNTEPGPAAKNNVRRVVSRHLERSLSFWDYTFKGWVRVMVQTLYITHHPSRQTCLPQIRTRPCRVSLEHWARADRKGQEYWLKSGLFFFLAWVEKAREREECWEWGELSHQDGVTFRVERVVTWLVDCTCAKMSVHCGLFLFLGGEIDTKSTGIQSSEWNATIEF